MDMELKHTQFIGLRAIGTSLAKISSQIGVSKPTLISWQKEFEIEISNAKATEIESTKESFRISNFETARRLIGLRAKFLDELETRDLKDITTDKLLKMFLDLKEPLEAVAKTTVMVEEGDMDFLNSKQVSIDL